MSHRPSFRRHPAPDLRYYGVCSCGWQSKDSWFYPGYAEGSADKHAEEQNAGPLETQRQGNENA